jgi:hypothetical protein
LLTKLAIARQTVPKGEDEAYMLYTDRIDALDCTMPEIHAAFEKLMNEPQANFASPYPSLPEILEACRLEHLRSRSAAIYSGQCETCDGNRFIVRTKDGRHPMEAPKGTPTHAIPCPTCRRKP